MVGILESGEEAALANKRFGSLADSINDVLCDPERVALLLWTSVLPSVE